MKRIAWNKGLTKQIDERLSKCWETRKKNGNDNQTQSTKNKISETKKCEKTKDAAKIAWETRRKNGTNIAWNKGLTKETNESIARVGKINSALLKGKKLSKERIKSFLRRRDKSSLELKMESIINKNNLPFKFVGNGELIIENKCPDFVHHSEKIVLEVYARMHKNKFKDGGVEKWKKERKEIFERNGYKILFFDETEIKEIFVLERLKDGNKS